MAIGQVLSMIPLALDSDVLDDWRYQKQYVKHKIDQYFFDHKRLPALTAVTVFEALQGFEIAANQVSANKAMLQRDRDEIEKIVQDCSLLPSGALPTGILPFDQNAARIAAYIAGKLKGRKILKDIFIASTALAHRHGVATRNEQDFKLIANHLPPSHPILRLAIWKP